MHAGGRSTRFRSRPSLLHWPSLLSRSLLLYTSILSSWSGCAATSSTYDPASSEWKQGVGWRPAPGAERRVGAEKLRASAREAFDEAAYRDALKGYTALREVYPGSQEAKDVETSFNIAESYYQLGESEYGRAYPFYKEVLKGNPPEEMLRTTLGRIYDIGRSFLDGRTRKTFLGISYRSPSYGVEILLGEEGLVTNYPFLKYSEDALMEVAKYYFDHGEYAEAEQVLDRMVRDYPQSTWNPTAEYQLALAVYRQVRGVDYDQEALRKASSKFNLYLNHHPRGPQVEEARGFLKQIAEMEGMHDLQIAKYYLRESQPQAAILYLRSVILNNPKTLAAREAREIYENLEKRRGES
jgi:outer membrane protein assembly factor BamD (BamD/ComL family)